MATQDFDPDIPVGETADYPSFEQFNAGANHVPSGEVFDPSVPVGEPVSYQPQDLFTPVPMSAPPPPSPMPADVFDPNLDRRAMRGGPKPAGLAIRSIARAIDLGIALFLGFCVAEALDLGASGALVMLGPVAYLYSVVFEAVLGWTPAKRILGLSVHASSRAGAPKPSVKQSLLRNLFLVSLLFPVCGLFIAAFLMWSIAQSIRRSPTKQGAHDKRATGPDGPTQVLRA
jgi:hypothetical protein